MADKLNSEMNDISISGFPATSNRNISDLSWGKVPRLFNNSTPGLVNTTAQESHHGAET